MTTTNTIIATCFIGILGTGVMDVWALILRKMFGIKPLDYALVGRWVGLMRHGQFCHRTIITTPPIAGERQLGWLLHYAIGMACAAVLIAAAGWPWLYAPTLAPALLVGVSSVIAPLLVMQPAFGFGFAATKTSSPLQACLRSLMAHGVFGIGLYLAARLFNELGCFMP
ncbi:DUF2938 domain-containing protein [Serratia odorifera]|jgi:hypothetical protein|uniref:DUF2938 domain-containing protein n=1 Tax=Serratia odorifera TaxID=618 RepID=UPI0029E1B0CA|nr:DUF2938 domain-containing protein [Serratia odorifera]